jgi:DNA-binding NarL/FixJ family response regulator
MPLMNGIEAARELSRLKPELSMLLVSVQEVSDQLIEAAREVGFRGAITKSRGREVVQAVDAVLHNQSFFRRDEPQAT